jgi:hypothetical protein
MESNSIENIEPVKSFHTVFDKPLVEIKKCHRCGSVFVTDFECEACGYQFKKEWVGNPLGTNSLYSLRQQYDDNLAKWRKKLGIPAPHGSSLTIAYRRRLLKRFENLFFYLENRELKSEEQNKLSLFMIELRDLCEEMMLQQISFDKIRRVVESSSDEWLKESVFNWLYTAEDRGHNFSWIDFLFSYRLGGAIRISFLGLFILVTALLSSLAIAFYS